MSGLVQLVLLYIVGCRLASSYPVQEASEGLLGDYKMASLAKKQSSSNLRDSLLSAFIMSELPRGGSGTSQRKKAVDSTFIRFGRSSLPTDHRNENINSGHDFDYYGDRNGILMDSPLGSSSTTEFVQGRPSSSSGSSKEEPYTTSDDCIVKTRSDFFRVLMNKSCARSSSRVVKRENVSDTFIRFGKRAIPRRMSDMKYGR